MFSRSLSFILIPFHVLKHRVHSDVHHILENPAVMQFLKVVSPNPAMRNKEIIQQLLDRRKVAEAEYESLQSLKDDDKEMSALIKEEKHEIIGNIKEINEHILFNLLPGTEQRDVLLEVTAGVGGKEAMHFAAELFEMYAKYSLYKGWQWEEQEVDVPEIGGMRHGSAFVSGRDASAMLMQESGVHRVQRVPATEKSGRIHTSTVTVAILPQPTEFEVVIKDKDIKMETKTSSGAGGQHVNKTESCVRITHIPTGIVIENQTDRSQIKNKKLAMQRLRFKLYQMELEGFRSKTQSSRKEQMGTSMRSEKIRTYNYQQDRITDHRLGISLHNLPQFLNGGDDLDDLIRQLHENDQKQQLLRFIEEYLKNSENSSKR